MAENQTTASLLMKSSGQVLQMVGFAFTSVATLYFIQYMSIGGCAMVEYMPLMITTEPPLLSVFFSSRNIGNITVYLKLILVLLVGVIIRKSGFVLTEQENIKSLENWLYRKSE